MDDETRVETVQPDLDKGAIRTLPARLHIGKPSQVSDSGGSKADAGKLPGTAGKVSGGDGGEGRVSSVPASNKPTNNGKLGGRPRRGDDAPSTVEVHPWRLAPTRSVPAISMASEELLDRIDEYFTDAAAYGRAPTLTDLAGASGFDSVQHLINHARRAGPVVMRGISRALTAVAAHYEDLAQAGNRAALAVLQQIPQFDSVEGPAKVPVRTFEARVPAPIVLAGVMRAEDRGRDLPEHEAYLQLIRNRTYHEAPLEMVKTNGNSYIPKQIDLAALTDESDSSVQSQN